MSRSSVRRAVGQLAVPLEHHAPLQEVRRRVNQQALGLEPVASRASGLLLVVLERLRRAGVHDEPHVRSIDPHAERHRRHDDVRVLVEERVLVAASFLVCEAGVIRPRPHTDFSQPRGQRVDLAA